MGARPGGSLTKPRRAVGALVLLLLAALWGAAAYALWDSRVPGGLRVPRLDAAAAFDAASLHRAERYERFFQIEFVISQVVLLGVLALYARRGARFARESAAGRIGTGMLLGMIGLALVWLSQVPFRLAEVWWDRRYDQAGSGYVATLFENWFQLGAEFLFVCLALLIVMALAGRFPRLWWLGAAPAFVGLATLFAFITPFLSPTKTADAWVRADARRYASAQGMQPVGVSVEDVSDFTDAPNAYAAGFGPTRRVVLWSTLLDGRFTRREVRVVLAHELGHHSRGHIVEGLGWYALFALPGTWLIAVATRRRGGMARPAAVPVSLLALVVLQLVSLPLQNAISRHMEQEADWLALQTTRDPGAARTLFRKFTTIALSDPDPPAWSSALLGSHPSVLERMELAEAWRARSR
jgi:Zn-dependent protease with chaperone function